MTLTSNRYIRPVGFTLLVTAVYGTAVFISGTAPAGPEGEVVSIGLTVDLVLFVPLAYYLILVRGQEWRSFTTVGVFLVSLYGASLVVPADDQELLHAFGFIAAPAELLLTGYGIYKFAEAIRSARRIDIDNAESGAMADADLLSRLRHSLREAFDRRYFKGGLFGDALAYELAVFYYALFSWGNSAPSQSSETDRIFSYHRSSEYGPVLAGLMMAMIAELFAGHLLLHLWTPTAAWIHTALGLYGMLWLLGDYRAMRLRPAVLAESTLHIRCGLRWSASIPLSNVARTERASGDAPEESYLKAVMFGRPDLIVHLKEPMEVKGPYWIRKEVSRIGVKADQSGTLLQAVEERCI